MLCLGAYVGEWIDMTLTEPLPAGTNLRLYVIDKTHTHAGKVNGLRIGIEAPRSVHVLRSDAIKTEGPKVAE